MIIHNTQSQKTNLKERNINFWVDLLSFFARLIMYISAKLKNKSIITAIEFKCLNAKKYI